MAERFVTYQSDAKSLKKVINDGERSACDEYLACLFILVADGGRY